MKQWHLLILRWLAWMILVAFESVVGFPWLSVYLASEWVLSFEMGISMWAVVLMAPILAAGYGVPLALVVFLLLFLRYVKPYTRRNSWQRWGMILGISFAIGWGGGTVFSASALLFTLGSAGVFLILAKNIFFQKLWRTKNWHQSFE